MLKLHVAHAALLALMVTGLATAGAQETTRVTVSPDSKLWIDGTSNLHSWSCKATELEAAIDIDVSAASQMTASVPKSLKHVQVKVPAKSLKCSHGGMDGNVYKALKADATPAISYIMASFDAVPGDADNFTLKTQGTLEIAGVEKTIEVDVVATRLADGTVKATGVVPIKMTDYGITPPTAIFGRLKTGDEVKVNFELTLGGKAIAAAAAGR